MTSRPAGAGQPFALKRRGTHLGWVARRPPPPLDLRQAQRTWSEGGAVLLPGALRQRRAQYAGATAAAARLMRRVAQGQELSLLLDRQPYRARLNTGFEMLATYQSEGDPQAIGTVEFDAIDRRGRIRAENLWVKAAWLSFEADDPSLRFRFSFGIADIDDVSADIERQRYAAGLAQSVFPESAAITENRPLQRQLQRILNVPRLEFLERIVYFNAPNGGAQFHHDVERAHLGVIFAQMTGRTAWLALSKPALIAEIQAYVAGCSAAELATLRVRPKDRRVLLNNVRSKQRLSRYLDDPDNEPLELLLNRSPAFTRRLIDRGYGFALQPGDVLLLPQANLEQCCWHSVFCLGAKAGEGLSFAMRAL